jgi:hypothetical protein
LKEGRKVFREASFGMEGRKMFGDVGLKEGRFRGARI